MIAIKFETHTDAFNEGVLENEVRRILNDIADQIEAGDSGKQITDVNGNRIGQWEFAPEYTNCHSKRLGKWY
jgi:hypothetical protein